MSEAKSFRMALKNLGIAASSSDSMVLQAALHGERQ